MQFEGDGAPSTVEYNPAEHCEQAAGEEARKAVEKEPAWHGKHVVEALTALYAPGTQCTHAANAMAAICVEKVPAWHAWHVPLPNKPVPVE